MKVLKWLGALLGIYVVFVLLFEREFIGKLRKPVAMNAIGG